MTIPMWAPFAFLAVVCALPPRALLRRVDWLAVSALTYCVAVWALVGVVVWRLVW